MTATLKYRSAGSRSSAVYSINQRSFKEHTEKGPPSDGAGESHSLDTLGSGARRGLPEIQPNISAADKMRDSTSNTKHHKMNSVNIRVFSKASSFAGGCMTHDT